MSTQLKEKQQTKSKEQVPTRDLQADYHFNQHLFRTVAYTAAGFGFGMLSSLLFKHKAGMTIFFAGAGAGYGSADFVNDLNKFRNQRGPTQIKREGGASSQIREKLDRTADSLKGDLQQAKNKVERGVEDMSGQVAGKVSQTARGAEEWARNASEKATQHFQSKDYRRGGDDDKDKDDSKSGKKETPRKDDSSLKRDVKDQVKQSAESLKKGAGDLKDKVKDSAESLKKDFKKDDSSLKKDAKDVKDQVKQSAESLKKSAGDLKDKAKDSAESLKKNAGDLKGKAKESVESLKKSAGDVKDKVKESAESLKKDFKKDDTQKKDQKKDDSSLKKDAKDLKDKVKDSAESLKKDFKKDDSQKKDQSKDQSKDLGEKTSFNTTLKGGMSTTAKKEEGSKEHRLMGDMRADQFTSKLPDKSPFQEGYSTPKPEQEGPVKVKREDKSQGGQDKTKADINRTYNQGGQHFQDFRSNPNELGKAGEISEIKQDYQRNRNKAVDPEADEKRRATKHLAQDIHGESIRQGLRHDVNMHSETRSGFQNYRTGVAPGDKANQENTKL